jgi:hypothetical protein
LSIIRRRPVSKKISRDFLLSYSLKVDAHVILTRQLFLIYIAFEVTHIYVH